MRLTQMSSHFLSLTTLLLSQQAAAALIPELLQHLDIFSGLEKRCVNPCGYYGQLCCASNQYCYTDANGQAACGTGTQGNTGGSWHYATTTYVQTDLRTVTATYSTFIGGMTQAPSNQCSYAQGQTPCGSTCCNAGYYCQASNMCVQVPGGSSGYYGGGIYTVTTVITNTAGAPLRPTTQTVLTLTSTGVAGTTAYQTPVGTGGAVLGASTGSGSGLSGGAIAGIVLGVIFGLLLLLLICACCCFKGLLDGLLSIFGGRRKRVTEETIVEERHSHRSGIGRTWFGTRPGRTEVVEEKKTSGFNRALGVTAFLGTTAALLGLKRSRDRRKDDRSSSSYSSSDYTYDYTSDSSPSSVTRTSRRSRR